MSSQHSVWRVGFRLGLALVMAVLPAAIAQTRPAAGSSATATGQKPSLKAEELEQMLAPLALYPDSLLTQILMASTYPLEVVQADRWTKEHPNLSADALTKALESQ